MFGNKKHCRNTGYRENSGTKTEKVRISSILTFDRTADVK